MLGLRRRHPVPELLEAMRSLYADEAVWEWEGPQIGLRHESADAYIEFFRESTASAELLVMTPHCPVIDLLGADSARARTTFHEIARGTAVEDGPLGPKGAEVSLQHFGIYYDDISRIDGSWKFTHRLAVLIYQDTGAVTGEVAMERANLLSPPVT